jgi:hypothetical protein
LPANRFGPPVSYRLYENESQNGMSTNRLLNLKMSILSNSINGKGMQFASLRAEPVVSQSTTLANGLSDLSVTFLGWTDQAPPDVTLDGYQIQKQVIGLVTQKLAYRIGDLDELAIPLGMIPGKLTVSPVNGGACGNGDMTGVYIQQGSAEFTFQVPDLGEYSLQELRLNLSIDGPPQNTPVIDLYQWADQAWATIKNPVIGVNLIAQPQNYLSSAGEIRVRISYGEFTGGFCSYIDLGFKAGKTGTNGGQDGSH